MLRSGAQPPPRAGINVCKIAVAKTGAGWVGLAFSSQGLAELHYPLPERDQSLAALQTRFPEAMALARKYNMKQVFFTARMYSNGKPDMAVKKVFGVTTFELG